MTFGSLFSGIGGFERGFEQAGMRAMWQCEIDADATRVLEHHWPDVQKFSDVKKVGKKNLPAVDVLCGGFPCQDLSVAGKRAGLAGKRSGLFFQFMRIVRELRPRAVVIENVPGLRSSPPGDPGRDFETVLRTVAALRLYECGWTCLDARWFGLAQRRLRVFYVLTRRDLGAGRAAEILALADRVPGHFAPREQAQADIAGTIGSCANGRGWNGDLDRAGAFVAATLRSRTSNPGVNPPGRGGEDDQNVVYQCHGNNVGPMGTLRSGNGGLTGGVPFIASPVAAEGGNRTSGPIDVATAVNACKTASGRQDFETETFIVNAAESCATERHARQSDVARCLDSTGGFATNQGGTVVRSGYSVRRLTPTEYARLQGFPDDHLDLSPPLSDSAKYRLIGNAVVPQIANWLARRLMEATQPQGVS